MSQDDKDQSEKNVSPPRTEYRNRSWLKGRFKDDFKLIGHFSAGEETKALFWALIVIIVIAVAFVLSYYTK